VCKKKWLWGVRTISLQAKALPGASILRTLIIHPPMISTLTIPTLTILELVISTLTIAWALGPGAFALRPGAIFAPPVAPVLESAPSGAMGGYGQTAVGSTASIAPRCPPFCWGLWGATVRLRPPIAQA
jgi:hypothetical protein